MRDVTIKEFHGPFPNNPFSNMLLDDTVDQLRITLAKCAFTLDEMHNDGKFQKNDKVISCEIRFNIGTDKLDRYYVTVPFSTLNREYVRKEIKEP